MNLMPPPETEDIKELKRWCDELYEFIKHPVFHTMEVGNVEGGNYTTFANDGELTQEGTARVEKELAFSLDGIGKGSKAPTITRLGNTIGWAFTVGDDGYMSFEIPPSWDSATTIKIIIHIYINEAFATADAATKWQATWSAVPEGRAGVGGTEPVDGATHTGTVTSANTPIPATAKCLQEISLGSIAVASLAEHDSVFLLISRIAADTTDPTAEPVIVHAEYEWYADKLGEAT